METLVWIVLAYCMIYLICEAILHWDYRTRISKDPKFDPGIINYERVMTIAAAIPFFNVYTVFIALRMQLEMRKIRTKRRKLANRLRESAKRHEENGYVDVSQSFRKLADQIENLE